MAAVYVSEWKSPRAGGGSELASGGGGGWYEKRFASWRQPSSRTLEFTPYKVQLYRGGN